MVEIENIKNLKKHIRYKLTDYKRGDKIKTDKFPEKNKNLKTITVDDAVNLIENLETDICKGCSCKILFCGYIPYCVYQFSFDRIDNEKIHSNDNLQIVCWNCNSSGYGSIKNTCT